MKKYLFFIGIDVSKPFVDFMVTNGKNDILHKKVENTAQALKSFLLALKTLPGWRISSCIFGMEHTGIYSNHVLNVLISMKANIVNEHSVLIKNSLGLLRGKNDKLDASRMADYLFRSRDKLNLWKGKRSLIMELSGLLTLRERLTVMLRNLKVPIKEEKGFIDKKISSQHLNLCVGSIAAIKADISSVEKKIKVLWTEDEILNRLMHIILSIPCVGELTALNVIITTNEFNNIRSPKKFACYAGVAPFSNQSGISIKKRARVSHAANKKTKSLLHTCAVLSVRFVPEIKAYFIRKTELEKKHRMLVYNAIRSKIILRIFSCINNNRVYIEDYAYTASSAISS